MVAVSLDTKSGLLGISNYEGSLDSRESISFTGEPIEEMPYDFFRTGSNHAYIQRGEISYEGDCNNNLIISSCTQNRLINIRNAFVFAGESHVEIIPIFELQEVISKGRMALSNKKINYHIPERVLKRENLPEVSSDRISEEVRNRYGIESRRIEIVISKRSRNGIYLIVGKGGDNYILKYRGGDKERAELISRILADIPEYFPSIYSRVDGSESYIFEMEKDSYGLEEFIGGCTQKERDLDSFSFLGNHIALLHSQLSLFSQRNKDLEKILMRSEYTSESNIASVCLDLAQNNEKHSSLFSHLKDIICEDLSNKMRSLPRFLIHRDLNHSNIIWRGNHPKIIDSESIGIYERVNEFIAPLLLGENMSRPNYKENTLPRLIDSYNQISEYPISEEEEKILPYLLKYALLKYYVIRTIRRKLKDKGYLTELEKNLQSLRGSKND